MKRVLSIVVAYVVLAYAPGEAQRLGNPYRSLAGDTGDRLCFNWNTHDPAIWARRSESRPNAARKVGHLRV